MHFIGCVRKGVPLPELPKRAAKKNLKKAKTRPPPTAAAAAAAKSEGVATIKGPTEAAKSPKRQSRLASLVGSPGGDGPCTNIPESKEPGVEEVSHSLGCICHSGIAETTYVACGSFLPTM